MIVRNIKCCLKQLNFIRNSINISVERYIFNKICISYRIITDLGNALLLLRIFGFRYWMCRRVSDLNVRFWCKVVARSTQHSLNSERKLFMLISFFSIAYIRFLSLIPIINSIVFKTLLALTKINYKIEIYLSCFIFQNSPVSVIFYKPGNCLDSDKCFSKYSSTSFLWHCESRVLSHANFNDKSR